MRGAQAVIRRGVPGDLGVLVVLEEKSFTTDRMTRAAWRRALSAPSRAVFVAVAGRVAGGAALVSFRRGASVARIDSVAVDPALAGRGLGRRLVEACLEEAQRRGMTRLRLEVRLRNRGAIALYDRCGFARRGILPDYYEDGAAALVFERQLPEPTP